MGRGGWGQQTDFEVRENEEPEQVRAPALVDEEGITARQEVGRDADRRVRRLSSNGDI
jgi:hypothetical protein